MRDDNTERIRSRILTLIESEFESDAAFERAMGLADKTVNNWRRARSSSFMKMLPRLSEEELHILKLYRKSRSMPESMRQALRTTLESTINLYITSYNEVKTAAKRRGPKKKGE